MEATINLKVGDLVKLVDQGWPGAVGVVSSPIRVEEHGRVLVHAGGCIIGMNVGIHDVIPAGSDSEGFAQLGYNLIKLGSHIIEKRLLTHTK
jgi:hypothetical protein